MKMKLLLGLEIFAALCCLFATVVQVRAGHPFLGAMMFACATYNMWAAWNSIKLLSEQS